MGLIVLRAEGKAVELRIFMVNRGPFALPAVADTCVWR